MVIKLILTFEEKNTKNERIIGVIEPKMKKNRAKRKKLENDWKFQEKSLKEKLLDII
jgi:hypothetical protein